MEDYETKKNPSLSINEMWGLVKKQENWGVEGYQVPKFYHDATKQAIRLRERDEKNNKHKREWPPKDWPVNQNKRPIPPKRPNYLDQVDKWAKSFYDPIKRTELIKSLNERTHPYDEKPKTPQKINIRNEYLKYESEKMTIEKQRSKAEKERMKNAEEALKSKHANRESKSKEQVMRDRYKLFGSLPKNDRISVVSDAEYMGEQNPYYNTFKDPKKEEEQKEEEDDNKNSNTKKYKDLFYPSKTFTWKKAPTWTFNKIHPDNNALKKNRDKLYYEELQKSFENKAKKREFDHLVDVRGTFQNQQDFKKPTEYLSSNEYKAWKQNYPDLYPGPQQYWKEPPLNINGRKQKSDEEEEKGQSEDVKKMRYMSREKTDKRLYKPMKQHIF